MERSDKNKQDGSHSGDNNQKKQDFIERSKQTGPGSTKGPTKGSSSAQRDPMSQDRLDRDANPEQESAPSQIDERSFNILVDSVPYMVKASPFMFNGEIRYRVSFNGSPEHVFTWDSSMAQLRAIDDDSSTLPDNLEIAISERLLSKR